MEKVRILVVDDETSMRVTLEGILGVKGYKVDLAESGEEALKLIGKNKYRVVITDIKMAGMSGVELFLKIKKLDPSIPVIVMTGYALYADIDQAIREGAQAILYKPLEIEKLIQIISESLEGKTTIMLVDNFKRDEALLREVFSKKGYEVVPVKHESDMVALLREHKFHVIVFDNQTIGTQSIDLLKKAKEIRPDLGIIRITATSPQEWGMGVAPNGSVILAHKPMETEKLLEVIENYLTEDVTGPIEKDESFFPKDKFK